MIVLIIILTCTFLLAMIVSFLMFSDNNDILSYDETIQLEKKEEKIEQKKGNLNKYT